MAAIDNGTNSDYSTNQDINIPVIHIGALDQQPSVKGGPYSEGVSSKAGQYGVFEMFDDGGNIINIKYTIKNEDGEIVNSNLGKELVYEEEIDLISLSNISIEIESSVGVYPVPSDNRLHVDIENSFIGNIMFNIYDTSNKQIFSHTDHKGNRIINIDLDLGNINAKVVLLHILMGDNQVVKKIIINN